MPLPKPREGESKDDFISRCEGDLADEYTDAKQRTAICFSQWKRKDNSVNELLIYDEIGGMGLSDKDFAKQLDKLGRVSDLTVRLNSPGGDLFMALAIYNLLKSHPAKVTMVIDALAASAGSVIAMAGDQIHMAPNAMLMIHNPMSAVYGGAADFEKAAALLNKVKDSQLVPTYAERTGLNPDDISQMMNDETWLSAQDAVDLRFATGIVGKKHEEDDDEDDDEDDIDDQVSLVLPQRFCTVYRNVPQCIAVKEDKEADEFIRGLVKRVAAKTEQKPELPDLSRYERDIAFMELMSQ